MNIEDSKQNKNLLIKQSLYDTFKELDEKMKELLIKKEDVC